MIIVYYVWRYIFFVVQYLKIFSKIYSVNIMRISFRTKIINFIGNIKNNMAIRRLGRLDDAKRDKRMLKAILNDACGVFDIPQSIEKFGFRADEDRPLNLDKSLLMACVSKTYKNGSAELSLFENEPSFPDKRVIYLLYYNSKAGNINVIQYGGVYTDKVSTSIKSEETTKTTVTNTAKETKPSPTRIINENEKSDKL